MSTVLTWLLLATEALVVALVALHLVIRVADWYYGIHQMREPDPKFQRAMSSLSALWARRTER